MFLNPPIQISPFLKAGSSSASLSHSLGIEGRRNTGRTQGRVRTGYQLPFPSRNSLLQVCDCGETMGIYGWEAESWTPDMEFEHSATVRIGDGRVKLTRKSITIYYRRECFERVYN
jgi:hypothetical protein